MERARARLQLIQIGIKNVYESCQKVVSGEPSLTLLVLLKHSKNQTIYAFFTLAQM
jgi:hypothetical protein